jgi:hypothetical protein
VTPQWASGIIAFGCSAYSFIPYWRGIASGVNKPSPLAWIIWSALCVELTAALAAAGGRAVLGLPIAETIGCTINAVLAWRAAKRRAVTGKALDAETFSRRTAAILAAACALALAGWWFAGPVPAALLLIAVDFTAGGITVNDVRLDPAAEPLASWWWYGTGEVFSTAAAVGAGWVFWASSLSGLTVAVTIIAMAARGGVTVRTPPRVLEDA